LTILSYEENDGVIMVYFVTIPQTE